MIPISRHFILKCVEMFLKSPNEYMQRLFRGQVEELYAHRKFLNENQPKVVVGQSITKNTVSDHISKQISNGPTAIAIDFVGKDYAKTPMIYHQKILKLGRSGHQLIKKPASAIEERH